MTTQNAKLKDAYSFPLIFDFCILIFHLLLRCHFAFLFFLFDFLLLLGAQDFPSNISALLYTQALHLGIFAVRPFRVVQHEAKASHYISKQPLVFNAFPAFYSLIVRMLHFPDFADQICLFYNLFCDAPTG
jgi:hypothetical protein